MRIVSKWKDYYDFISHQFGADKDCTYIRGPLKLTTVLISVNLDDVSTGCVATNFDGPTLATSILIAGLHAIPLIGEEYVGHNQFEVYSDAKHGHLMRQFHCLRRNNDGEPDSPRLPSLAQIKVLIQAVGMPVFRFKQIRKTWPHGYGAAVVWEVDVDEKVPILKDCGIPAVVS